jgi:hypothetical protein
MLAYVLINLLDRIAIAASNNSEHHQQVASAVATEDSDLPWAECVGHRDVLPCECWLLAVLGSFERVPEVIDHRDVI